MATITPRKRKDGSVGYTAQIRIMRDGKKVYSESQTFDRKQAAQSWAKKREAELEAPGGLEIATGDDPSLSEVINRYLTEIVAHKPIGRTKECTLRQIARSELGKVPASQITSAHLVDYANQRITVDGVKKQTASNDIAIISSVFAVAEPAWGYRLNHEDVRKAKAVMRKIGMWGRPKERTRRPTLEELDRLMAHSADMHRRRPWALPLIKLIAFAIFSTRRMDEILRIVWDDVDFENRTVIVRNMKNPSMKWGNDVTCKLPDEAWAILESMPRLEDRIFPYEGDALGASFLRAMRWVDIEDLHFHDLRHEGVSRLFEIGWEIPRVAAVSGHRDWNSLRRYTHLIGHGDKYEGWKWLQVAIDAKAQATPKINRTEYNKFEREEMTPTGIRRVKKKAA